MGELRTDDPEVMLLALRVVDAVVRGERVELAGVLREVAAGPSAHVMLSLASIVAQFVRAMPDGEERLREWMLASDLEIRDVPS